ncbi:MAG: hypothetical protein Q8Q90_03430 [bacterium]|nr:hypothetical protein [bacterium]
MKAFFINKLEIILTASVFVFLIIYILFSGLSTSLDFKIDELSLRQLEAKEVHGNLLTKLAQTEGVEALAALAGGLKLVEINLANGYVDIRSSKEVSSVVSFAKDKP